MGDQAQPIYREGAGMRARAAVSCQEDVPAVDSSRLVKFLKTPATHDDRPNDVECIETHISWVFLTDRFAYKLKKPVRFEFLDFSTPQLRHEACEAEVTLNRRLAPHVYLGVVPVTLRDGQLHLGGAGREVDWLVKMQRLPADRSLDQLIRTGCVTPNEVRRVGRRLSEFYQALAPIALRAGEYRREIQQHVGQNLHELLDSRHGLDATVVRRVHEAQWRVLRLAPELLDTRVLDGRIVEGHGDLRPEHIYLVPYPTIIDCVEFNAEFRQIDVLDELCFLAMECAALDAAWVGDEVIAQYCQWNADQPPAALLPFYKTYRACVRAKVSALRAEQLTGQARLRSLESAKRYLAVADVYAGQLGPTFLLMVRGLTGTGKSTLASGLADLLGVERLQTDAIRQEMFGTSPQPAAYGEGIYQPSHRARVYEQMLQRSRTLLAAGRSVILDGTFLAAKYRTEAVAAAESLGALPLIVHCQCPEPLAIQRLRARAQAGTSASESRPDIYFEQQRDEEPDPAEYPVCHADTGNSPQAVIDVVLARLKSAWAAQT